MRKFYLITLLTLVLISVTSAFADTAEIKMAFVNMEKIATDYEEFIDVLKELEGEIIVAQTEDQAKLDAYTQQLTDLETKLSGPLTPEASEAAQADYLRIANEAMAFRENAFARYEQMQVLALQEVYKKVYAKIAELAQAEEYEAIFDSAVFAYIDETKVDDITDYDNEYRPKRQAMLELACGAAKNKFDHLKTVVGIAIDAPKYAETNSEDFILMDCSNWTDGERDHYEKANEGLGFFKTGTVEKRTVTEFPVVEKPKATRRVKVGRNAICPCGSGKKYKKCCLGRK